jgi:hypothetical protein
VSMADYWYMIATPFFFIVLGFCLYVLFNLNNIQLADPATVRGIVDRLQPPNGRRNAPPPRAGNGSNRPAPPPPPPAKPAGRAAGNAALARLNAARAAAAPPQ